MVEQIGMGVKDERIVFGASHFAQPFCGGIERRLLDIERPDVSCFADRL